MEAVGANAQNEINKAISLYIQSRHPAIMVTEIIAQYTFPLWGTVYAIYFAGFLFSRISRVGCYSRIYQHAKIFTSDPDA